MGRILKKDKRGFTLLEILIVIVILAVLAGLAIPIYAASVEKSRAQEAIQGLSQARGAMLRYFASNGTYVGATLRAFGGAAAATDIDADINNLQGGQNQLFDYTLGGLGAGTFTVTATRINGRPAGAAAPGGANTITINQAGTVVRSAIYQ